MTRKLRYVEKPTYEYYETLRATYKAASRDDGGAVWLDRRTVLSALSDDILGIFYADCPRPPRWTQPLPPIRIHNAVAFPATNTYGWRCILQFHKSGAIDIPNLWRTQTPYRRGAIRRIHDLSPLRIFRSNHYGPRILHTGRDRGLNRTKPLYYILCGLTRAGRRLHYIQRDCYGRFLFPADLRERPMLTGLWVYSLPLDYQTATVSAVEHVYRRARLQTARSHLTCRRLAKRMTAQLKDSAAFLCGRANCKRSTIIKRLERLCSVIDIELEDFTSESRYINLLDKIKATERDVRRVEERLVTTRTDLATGPTGANQRVILF